jgi:glutaconate CoA-transferase subunit B
MSWQTIIQTRLDPRKFVERCDFSSSPGYIDGTPGARERAGLPAGTGPWKVVTERAIFGFDEETHP